jgi:hypothetical protein
VHLLAKKKSFELIKMHGKTTIKTILKNDNTVLNVAVGQRIVWGINQLQPVC